MGRTAHYIQEQRRFKPDIAARDAPGAMEFTIVGFNTIMAILDQLGHKVSRKYLLKVFTTSAKPLIKTAKSLAPVSKKVTRTTHHIKKKKGKQIEYSIERKSGDLRRSIRGFIGKSKSAPTYWVGPQFGKMKKPDAYYAHWVEYGTQRGIKEHSFMRDAWKMTGATVQRDIVQTLKLDLEKLLSDVRRRKI